jgi:L-lactate oxidase
LSARASKALEVINVDLLEAEAKTRLSEGVYVFIAHSAGEQWMLRENRRAFGDYVFTPHRMGGIVRDTIDTSITMLGEKFPHPVFVSPMGSHGLVHPEAEIATAQGAAKSGGLFACRAPRPPDWRISPRRPPAPNGSRCI